MSGRGGIYEGPDGTKLYGDGREVNPVTAKDAEDEQVLGERDRAEDVVTNRVSRTMKEHFLHLSAVCPVLNDRLIGPVRLTIGPEPPNGM